MLLLMQDMQLLVLVIEVELSIGDPKVLVRRRELLLLLLARLNDHLDFLRVGRAAHSLT